MILGFIKESSLFLNLGEMVRPRRIIEARYQKVEGLKADQERKKKATPNVATAELIYIGGYTQLLILRPAKTPRL